MIDKKDNRFITEISEEDFRKLDLIAYEQVWITFENTDDNSLRPNSRQLVWKKVKLNDILDQNIEFWIEQGYENDYDDLQQPVTVAIHNENGPEPKDYYFDKFMNRYSGFKTYEFAMGLKHIYSTRDYFESKKDYWRVPKRETKAVYRVHLNETHLKRFKLKHKKEIAWIFNDSTENHIHTIEKSYDLDEKTGEWKLISIVEVRRYGNNSSYTPISAEEEQKLIDSQPDNGLHEPKF